MTELSKRDLGESAKNYVRTRLKNGGEISKRVIRSLASGFHSFSPLPRTARDEQVDAFDRGSISNEPATIEWLAKYLLMKTSGKSPWTFWVEDSWAKPSDPLIANEETTVYIAAQSVLYAISQEEFSEVGVNKLLRSVSSFNYIGFVANVCLPSTQHAGELSLDCLDVLGQNIVSIVVDAYDREGVIISEIGRVL